jgi:hypothetical protein
LTFGLVLLATFVTGGAVTAVARLLGSEGLPALPPVTASHLPVTIGKTAFNIPADAFRIPAQRHSGAHERIDLAFAFPDLTPATTHVEGDLVPRQTDVLMVTLGKAEGDMPARERARTLYPRFLSTETRDTGFGLSTTAFRKGSPYLGEDLVREPGRADGFLARCTRDEDPLPGICTSEKRIGSVEVTVRFPRRLLSHWRDIDGGLTQIVASLGMATR